MYKNISILIWCVLDPKSEYAKLSDLHQTNVSEMSECNEFQSKKSFVPQTCTSE